MNESWEDVEETTEIININKLSPEKKREKEEIEKGNIQSVIELFKVIPTSAVVTNVELNPVKQVTVLKTMSDYSQFSKECSRILVCNKATSLNVLSFLKTIIADSNLSIEQINSLLLYLSYLKEPIKKSSGQKKREISIINHAEVFGEASILEDDYSNIEDKYA
jgi:hypothetical protein